MTTKKTTTGKDQDKPVLAEKTVTVEGVKVTVATEAMKRLDVMEAMDESQSGENPFAIIRVLKSVFGAEKYEEIKDHLEEKHGQADIENMMDFFKAVLKKVSPNS
jgi:hypothetical protein